MPLFKGKDKAADNANAVKPAPANLPDDKQQHEAFILSQIRFQLDHLAKVKYLRESTTASINALLDEDMKPPEDRLGPKNAAVRNWLGNGDALPEIVDQVLSIVLPGIQLGALQSEALNTLLSKYSPQVARTVTNPVLQDKVSKVSIDAAKATQRAVAQGYRTSLAAVKKKEEAQSLAETLHQERMKESIEAAQLQKRASAFDGDGKVVETTEMLDKHTQIHTSCFSPEVGVFITTVTLYSSDPAVDELGEGSSRPTTATNSLTPSSLPLPPPRHHRSLTHDPSYDPPLPPPRRSISQNPTN